MTESELKDSKSTVEDGPSTDKSEVKDERDAPNELKEIKNIPAIAGNVENAEVAHNGTEMDVDGDSEAETLIQSPEKKRGSTTDGSTIVHSVKIAGSDAGSIVVANTSDKENATRKRKRSHDGRDVSPSTPSSHRSSPLSSPLAQMHSEPESDDSSASVRKPSPKMRNHSEAEDKITAPKKRRRRPSEIVPPSSSHKRSKRNSIDTLERRETRSATYPRPSDDEKSPSPQPIPRKEHRRGASTQLTHGELGEKKRRGRPPVINTRRNRSVDRASEDSDGSEPRTNRARPALQKLASHDHDVMSPVKPGPRKWKDKVGRTPLARACNDGDLDVVKARFAERPEDLHEQDNAKNTPLQIASIEGWDEVVEFLLTKGAEVNVRNIDGDTPLIDAVENGHVPVIKLLLQHGANARMANMKGYEPAELAKRDDENYDEIRELLEEAKEKVAKKTPGFEAYDSHNRDGASSRAASAASPRDSPPIGGRSPPAFGSRRRTGRSESTRNDLLYQANTQENLVKLAGKGDVQGVVNILSILEKAETESLIAAAKAGHEEVLGMLIAMGKPHPDPDPVRGPKMASGYNTPMLAAIGKGHPGVVELLANQSGFNPTRKYRDRTYFQLAEERKGDRWEEEVKILKQAYDKYKGKKSQSPRKAREGEKTRSRPRRSSSANSAGQRMSSPDALRKAQVSRSKDGAHGERRKDSDPLSEKHRPRNAEDPLESSSIAVASDLEQTISAQTKNHRTRRSQSDLPPVSAGPELAQRRRRLVTGKEHRSRQAASPSPEHEEDDDMAEVKLEDRPQSALKRTRANSTPDPPDDKSDRSALKKRKTVLESSPDDVRSRTSNSTNVAQTTADSEANGHEDTDMGDVDQSDADKQKADPANLGNAKVEQVKRESPSPVALSQAAEQGSLPDADPIKHTVEQMDSPEGSDDHYSPPPATEPPVEIAPDDTEQRAKEEAEKAAAEQRLREEEARKAQELRAAQEKAENEARAKREAEERQKQEEEQLRIRQEAEERERRRREAQARIQQEQRLREQERKRIEGLPVLLARTAEMIDSGNPEAKQVKFLRRRYLPLYTVRARDLALAGPDHAADEEWIPSFQVAGLLSTKDLALSAFPSLSKTPATDWELKCMWRWARSQLSYELNHDCWSSAPTQDLEIERQAESKFFSMERPFWVKRSDLLEEAARVPHLKDVQLSSRRSSLLDYANILGSAKKRSQDPHPVKLNSLPNGTTAVHVNGVL